MIKYIAIFRACGEMKLQKQLLDKEKDLNELMEEGMFCMIC